MFKPSVTLSVVGLFLICVVSMIIGAIAFGLGSMGGFISGVIAGAKEGQWQSIGKGPLV